MSAVLRFAPSPNGCLHLGHALSALVGYRWARRLGGRFLVRIEDIDIVRCKPAFIAAALEDLAWLGIRWEEPVRRQSEHFDDYARMADQLRAAQLLYPCFATRAEIERAAMAVPGAVDPEGAPLYPGLYRGYPSHLAERRKLANEPCALRLDMAKALALATERLAGAPLTFHEIDDNGRVETVACRPERWGDVVIVRKDTPTSYHLSVVVDDALQGITHIVRGRDLYDATDLHRLLQVLLQVPGWRTGPLYHHHRLITDELGRKLAKSAGDTSLKSLRLQGWSAAEVCQLVGVHAGPQVAPE